MDKHPSLAVRDRYIKGELDPSQVMALSDHLFACAECARIAERSDGERVVDALMAHAPEHPDYEAIERFISGTSDSTERDFIERHLTWCAGCAAEVDNLRDFVNPTASFSAKLVSPAWRSWLIAAMVTLVVGGLLFTYRFNGSRSAAAVGNRVVIRDGGGTIAVDSAGTVHGVPRTWQGVVGDVLSSGRLKPSRAAQSFGFRFDALRGDAADSPLRAVYPTQIVILEQQPTFTWTSDSADASFIVQVFDADFSLLSSSGPLKQRTWRPARPLPRGRRLQWQVIETIGSRQITAPQPPAPAAQFVIVDAGTADRIRMARSTRSHLLLAALYARAGMHTEAADEIDALARLNPGSELVRRLQSSLSAPSPGDRPN